MRKSPSSILFAKLMFFCVKTKVLTDFIILSGTERNNPFVSTDDDVNFAK